MESSLESLALQVKPEWRKAFVQFVQTGDASPEFLDYLERDPDCQRVAEQILESQVRDLQALGRSLSEGSGLSTRGSGPATEPESAGLRTSGRTTPRRTSKRPLIAALVLAGSFTLMLFFGGRFFALQRDRQQDQGLFRESLAQMDLDLAAVRRERDEQIALTKLSEDKARFAEAALLPKVERVADQKESTPTDPFADLTSRSDSIMALQASVQSPTLLNVRATPLLHKAQSAFLLGPAGEWQVAYNEATRLDPKHATAYFERGLSFGRRGDYDQAIADFTKVIQLESQEAAAYFNRGNCYASKEEDKSAIADYTKVIELDSAPPTVRTAASFNRAVVYRENGEDARAVADFEHVIQLDPKQANAYNSLAWIWATSPKDEIRRPAQAVAYAWKACELTNWKRPNYFATLAAACANAGDFDEAIRWQEKLLETMKTAPEKQRDWVRVPLRSYKEHKPFRDQDAPKESPK